MKPWTCGMLLMALAGITRAATVEIQHWSGALQASIWDNRYQRGLGGTAGVETHCLWETTAAAQFGYSYFPPVSSYTNLNAVNEFDATLGLKKEFHPTEDNLIYPRLGLHLGASRNWEEKFHVLLGGDVEGVIPISHAWSLFAAFQPSYSFGVDNQAFERVALGVLFDAKP